MTEFNALFSRQKLDALFPEERSDQFFDALFGDAGEGAYNIRLCFKAARPQQLMFDLELHQRPGKCLACNLTYGLPEVFARHPIVDIKGLVACIDEMLTDQARCAGWNLGATREITRKLHVVPLTIDLMPPLSSQRA
jgi:hypothetical protein